MAKFKEHYIFHYWHFQTPFLVQHIIFSNFLVTRTRYFANRVPKFSPYMHYSQVLFKPNFEKEQKCIFRSKENIEFRMIWQESFHMTFMLFHSKRISKVTHFYQCLGMSGFILSPSTLPRIFLNAFFQGEGRRLSYFYFLSWLYRESSVLVRFFPILP